MLYELSVLFVLVSCSYPQFSSSEEAAAIEEILQAYDDGDEEAARRVLSLPLIKYMDNAVCIIALDKQNKISVKL